MKNWKKRFLALCLLWAMFLNMMPQFIVKAATPAPTVTKKTLYVGYKNYTIKMQNLEKGSEVKYSSSNKKVATVTTKGVIKPVATGKATITITVTKSKKVVGTSSVAVTVKNPYVWISNKTATIKMGETYQFIGKTYGLGKTSVTWTSSNKKVATINAKTGELKAVAEGTTMVTFKDKTSGKKSVCQVAVKKGETVDKDTLLQIYQQVINNLEFYPDEQLDYYYFIYLDDDDIPECLVWTNFGSWREKFTLISYHNGEAIYFESSHIKEAGFSYIPKSGMFYYSGDTSGETLRETIELSDDFATIASEVTIRDMSLETSYSIPGKKNANEEEYVRYQESLGFSSNKEEHIYLDASRAVFMSEAYDLLMGKSLAEDKQVSFSGKTVSKEKAEIGDTIIFGNYEQDNVTSNGKEAIEWLVLDKQDGKLLLLSKYALDFRKYSETSKTTTWEFCTLRKWLNDTFYKTAFNEKEQSSIMMMTIKNDDTVRLRSDGSVWSTSGGNDTRDKIFLLSIGEATAYFNPDPNELDTARRVQATAYARGQGGWINRYGDTRYWLRSPSDASRVPGDGSNAAAVIDAAGIVLKGGASILVGDYAVRPALWLSVKP